MAKIYVETIRTYSVLRRWVIDTGNLEGDEAEQAGIQQAQQDEINCLDTMDDMEIEERVLGEVRPATEEDGERFGVLPLTGW